MATTTNPLCTIGLDQTHATSFTKADRLQPFTATDFCQIVHCGAPFTENMDLSNFGLQSYFI
jgi:hypothetical protein